jgi:hypothetical protein
MMAADFYRGVATRFLSVQQSIRGRVDAAKASWNVILFRMMTNEMSRRSRRHDN